MAINPVLKNTFPGKGIYGLVICGGKSSRMGMDKSMLNYHGKPQCYHMYEMLSLVCEKVFISCNEEQANKIIDGYQALIDLPCYSNTGPIAGLLTAFPPGRRLRFSIEVCTMAESRSASSRSTLERPILVSIP